MIRKDTVLILGAGASADYNFPLGRGLIMSICSQLSDEHSSLFSLLKQCSFKSQLIRDFSAQLKESNLPSIDAFLENRAEFEQVGKVSIAGTLIPYETKDSLCRSGWYEYLHSKLIGKSSEFSANRLTVVTFNYDRSFEYALFLALRSSYGLRNDECAKLLQQIRIIHVYGQLGESAYLSPESESARAYMPDLNASIAMECAKAIKVVHEGSINTEEFLAAQQALIGAEIVCCLGFGYHPANVKRLLLDQLPATPNQKRLFFSTYGLTQKQTDKLQLRLFPNGWPGTFAIQFGTKDKKVLDFLEDTAALE